MFKRTIVLLGLILFFSAGTLYAESKIKLAILPFNVFSDTPQDNLSDKIPQMLHDKLALEGSQIIMIEKRMDTDAWEFSDFREQGIKLGVDYILSGSIFVAGQGVSIDTKLVNIYEEDGITSLYSNVKSSENLFSAVSKISKEITGEVFQKIIISDVEIAGNKRIEADAILRIIDTQPGDLIKPGNITKDLRKIYKMGYFDDVVVEEQAHDKGVKVVFNVVEKPSVRKVRFEKNHIFEDEELFEFVDTHTGSILNLHKINSDVKRIRMMYLEKNYYNCKVSYKILPLENSQADIVFTILEGNKIKVEKITFEGNQYFSDSDIKDAMQTSEKGFFSFFTSSGDLKEAEVKNDVVRIESLYKNNGFVNAKVSDPIIDIGDESIDIHFKIKEGNQYTVNKVDITGDLIVAKEVLTEMVQSQESELYNRDNVRKDIHSISDFYSNEGYANVDIKPLIDKNSEDNNVNITYSIDKKTPVYFNRINISGNYKTRDKVIRREIKIEEQGLFSKKKIQQSYKNLNRLDYFDSIDVKPVKTDKEDELDLNVEVADKNTGQLSFGAGYSSDEEGFVTAEVKERNLWGKGQTGKVSARISTKTVHYNIAFYEPYIMDTPISGGLELYREEKEYDYYDRDAIGFIGTLGYRLFDYARIGVRYRIEDFEVYDVQSDKTYMMPGTFFLSSIEPFFKYDSRDDLFMPTEGMTHKLSIEYAGEFVGGDIDYTKYLAESSVFFPFFWKFTLGLHAEGGYIDDRSDNNIDIDYEKFYLGGINSIRGFDNTDINASDEGDPRERGGDKYVQFNMELTFPLVEEYNVGGVFFYDRGDVYSTGESIDLGDQYSSFGAGIRWNSPLGPIRLEYGVVIDGKHVKDAGDGEFEFSVGASF